MLAAPFLLSAGLLVASGIGKLVRPAPAVAALGAAGLRGGRGAARALGAVEVVAGLAALWRPSALTAGLVAGLYLAFAAFLVRLIRRGGATTCGCVGSAEAPPSMLHVALDLVAVGVALGVAVWPVPSLGSTIAASPMGGVPFVIGLVGAGVLLAITVVEVPRAWRSYRPAHEEHAHAGHAGHAGHAVHGPGARPIALVERPR
ncbi:MAG TPA: MauE/DoxX family redox-associated membrane protein [Actinomycetota bacterium]|nr:MauE/DoxX family redox-associated membrane protein [Actinomycetota bacterium]